MANTAAWRQQEEELVARWQAATERHRLAHQRFHLLHFIRRGEPAEVGTHDPRADTAVSHHEDGVGTDPVLRDQVALLADWQG